MDDCEEPSHSLGVVCVEGANRMLKTHTFVRNHAATDKGIISLI